MGDELIPDQVDPGAEAHARRSGNPVPASGPIRRLESTDALQHTMRAYFSRLREAAESGSRPVAWCSSVGPVELLRAMGFEVYFPENHAAMLGATRAACRTLPSAVSDGYSPEVCSYLTSDVGAFLQGETALARHGFTSLPRPDVLVFNTNQCQEIAHWFSFYGRHYRVPVLGLRTPLHVEDVDSGMLRYMADQARSLVPPLEKICGRVFNMERFREVVQISREACVLWRRILETARHRPSPLTFFDASIHMGPIVVMRGTEHAVAYYRGLLTELEGRMTAGVGALPDEKYRLYWDGMPMWFAVSRLAGLFAGLGASVVASTYCSSWAFDELDPDDPFGSSALASTRLFITRSEEAKEDALARWLGDFGIDGIVYHDALTCPRNSNTRFGLPGRLHARTRVPWLELQGDLNDARCFGEGQAVTAVETFVQQLEMRREHVNGGT